MLQQTVYPTTSRVTIFLIPDTPGEDIHDLVYMALGAQGRYGKRIGLPWLKHFHDSLPTDLLINWIPNPFPEFDLLIFRGDYYSQTTWLLHPDYRADMSMKHYELFDRTLLNYNEMEELSAHFLWHRTHVAAEAFPRSRNIGLMSNPPPPPLAAMNMLRTTYDTFITRDAITDIMADKVGDIRHKYTRVDPDVLNEEYHGNG
jgi:hypothetical protein